MTLRIYNTLTRTKEVFTPIDPTNVRMYVCGPTVYDYAHIGNARPAIVFDVLFRLLRHIYGPEHVNYVRNITDVDDKINARALRDYPNTPLNDAIRKVTEKTYDQYQRDVAALGCLPPTAQPRATEHIQGMVDTIRTLINRGHAYEAGGEVLFDVMAMKDYGALSGRKQEDLLAGARIAVDAHKKNASDFVLWKQSAPDEPGWDSPWGRGRPGWHIECSVMAKAHLGEVFDIHGGGLDLIFPHHENEIAQSRCANGTHGTDVMANYWMHNGFLQVEGQKMSKSLGNFITIADLLETNKFGGLPWTGDAIRLTMLMTHYSQPIDWTAENLAIAGANLHTFHHLGKKVFEGVNASDLVRFAELKPSERLLEILEDDLNTPAVFHSHLFGLVKQADQKGGIETEPVVTLFGDLLFLGLDPYRFAQEELEKVKSARTIDDDLVNSLVVARLEARMVKDFAESDRIRDQLLAIGIQIKDVKDPVTGELKTEWEVKR
jgi:cysteinyl-tRNA synthetase